MWYCQKGNNDWDGLTVRCCQGINDRCKKWGQLREQPKHTYVVIIHQQGQQMVMESLHQTYQEISISFDFEMSNDPNQGGA